VRFILPFPDRKDRPLTHKKSRGQWVVMTENQREKAYDQALRSRWRALLLVIKAKLEAVDVGISTIEQEFLANVVLPNDQLLGRWLLDNAIPLIRGGQMPRLLEGPKKGDVIDAEILGPHA
jgi:hypothetical protein